MTIIDQSEWKIVHIPDKLPVPPHQQPTVDVYVATVNPKDANALVRKLNQIASLENFRHVKRIRQLQLEGGKTQLLVILCLACENDQKFIPNDVLELINLYQLDAFITKVCKFAPLSKEEWKEQCKLWPTSYHPPTYTIDGITGFNEADTQYVLYFMKLAVHMAFFKPQVVNAAIIVDPSTKQVIARACDNVFPQTPSSGQMSVEACCSKQEEAFSSQSIVCDTDNLTCLISSASLNLSTVSCLSSWSWAKQMPPTRFCHPLKHAAMVAFDYSATRDLHLFPSFGANLTPTKNLQIFSRGSPMKRQKISIDVGDEEKGEAQTNGFPPAPVRPYLCTGYDLFTVWEPCTMCAMAVVHQRVRRIFYAFPNQSDGALGSVHRLQGEKCLNHHYAVFRVLVPEKILQGVNPHHEAQQDMLSLKCVSP